MQDGAKLGKRTEALGSAPLGPLLVRLSIPGIVGMLVMTLYNVVDTFWVAGLPYGPRAIAALTVLFPLQMVAGALGIGTGVGVASLVARRFGEKRLEQVNDVAGNAVAFPLLSGSVLAVVSLIVPTWLVTLFGATEEIRDLSVAYLTIVALGYPFLLFNMTVNGLYRGAGNTLMPMIVMASSALLNLVLDPLLIYGVGPIPQLGVRGAAIATVISQVAGFLVSAGYLWSGRSGYRVKASNVRLRAAVLRDIAQVGAPAFAMQLATSLGAAVFNWLLAGYGAMALAAYGLTFRMMMLVFPLIAGVRHGLLPIVGYNFGAGQYRRMWQAFVLAATRVGALALALAALMWISAPQIVRIFTQEAELVGLAQMGLRTILTLMCLGAVQMLAVATLQGMGMGPQAMVLTLVRQPFTVVPAGILLSSWYGLQGAFAAYPLADLLSVSVTLTYLWVVHKRYRVDRPRPEAVVPATPAAAAGQASGET